MKSKLTIYVDENKKMLAKERGYNFSKIMNESLDILLDITDQNELILKNKINNIDVQIHELNFKRKLLIHELEDVRTDLKKVQDEIKKKKLYNSIVKEMRETQDINPVILKEKAEILGVKPEELFNKARVDAGWIKKDQ